MLYDIEAIKKQRFDAVIAAYPFYNKQIRFPKSKKKRIRKKWTKDPNNWILCKEITPCCYPWGITEAINNIC